jgi:hypothetical protein
MKAEKSLKKNLTCIYCKELVQDPLTVIPCGHTFCAQKCKRGYNNECFKCKSKAKIEALSSNKHLDLIIEIVKLLEDL